MARPKTATKTIVDKAFARRFEEACNLSDHVPAYNHGRLRFIQDELAALGIKASRETVRKWYAGEARPRPDKMKALARILKVDEAWLSIGTKPAMTPVKTQVANVEGAVNVVAGIFAMNGASYAWAEDGDEGVHFVAIYKAKKYSVYVAAGEELADGIRFNLPNSYEGKLLVGLIRKGAVNVALFQIPEAMVEAAGVKMGGHVELTAQIVGSVMMAGGVRAPKLDGMFTGG